MAAATQAAADLRQRVAGELSGEVHRYVTSRRYVRTTIARQQRPLFDSELMRRGLDYVTDPTAVSAGVRAESPQHTTRQLRCRRLVP